jgi:RsiW-degrading membrane proteinase PrsW (M82 family)
MSIDTVHPGSSAATSSPRWRRVPRRFFVGTLLLYGIVLGTYFLRLTPAHRAFPDWRTIVPCFAFASFYVSSGLFLLILGRGHVSRWDVLKVIVASFVLTCALTLAVRAELLLQTIDPSNVALRNFVQSVGDAANWLFSGVFRIAIQVAVEEAFKLLPVFILIATGRLKTAHDAMICGALAGLTFGTVESVSYGYLQYAGSLQPLTVYLTRFFVMAPLHGIWDALGAGLVFFLSGRWRSNDYRRPGIGAYLAAYCCAVVFHIAHNSLQDVLGPSTQIITVFAMLAPLYVMSKTARRWAEAQGEPEELPFIGDLHLLMISLATWLLATSVAFAWAMGPVPQIAQ